MEDPNPLERIPESDLLALLKTLEKYFRSMGLRESEAEDAAHAGLLRCVERSREWKGHSSLKTFLVTVGKFAGIDYLRKEARQEKIKLRLSMILRRWRGLRRTL